MNSIQGIECVVFDLDGVLIDSSMQHAQAYSELWAFIGIDGPDYSELAGQKTVDVVRNYIRGTDINTTRVDELVNFKQQRARELLMSVNILFPDSKLSLERIISITKSTAIATAASSFVANYAASQLAPSRLFDAIVTAEDVSRSKPDPEVFNTVINRCNTVPAKTLIIEDSAAGLSAAIQSGALVACVRSGLELSNDRFLGSFAGLEDLSNYLSGNTK
jgi:beta-phosphoglucomutase